MVIEISLTIIIMIMIITEFIKYTSEKYIPSILSMSSRSYKLCNNKLNSYHDGFCSKNRDSNNFCMKTPGVNPPEVNPPGVNPPEVNPPEVNPPDVKPLGIKKLEFGQLMKNKQYRDKNINDSLGITEDTLFNRDVNNGYTLKYW